MAILQDELDPAKKAQTGAQSAVLTGNSSAPATPTTAPAASPVGSGWTNLDTYLSANKGQGQGLAGEIVGAGNTAVAGAQKAAGTASDTFVTNATNAANNGAAGAIAAEGIGDHSVGYQGPNSAKDLTGRNQLEDAYKNVSTTADNYAGDFSTQNAALQKQHGYGAGFGALDTFLGRQDGKEQIQGWRDTVKAPNAQQTYDKVDAAIGAAKGGIQTAKEGFAAKEAKAAEIRQNERVAAIKREEEAAATAAKLKAAAEQQKREAVERANANRPAPTPTQVANNGIAGNTQAAQVAVDGYREPVPVTPKTVQRTPRKLATRSDDR